jgi:hypothetical protein
MHGTFADIRRKAQTGEIDIETMLLLDVSSSMGWNHKGFDQPRHMGP